MKVPVPYRYSVVDGYTEWMDPRGAGACESESAAHMSIGLRHGLQLWACGIIMIICFIRYSPLYIQSVVCPTVNGDTVTSRYSRYSKSRYSTLPRATVSSRYRTLYAPHGEPMGQGRPSIRIKQPEHYHYI